jgi:hypothetical protein
MGQSTKQRIVKHYKNMITWAETQEQHERPNLFKMKVNLSFIISLLILFFIGCEKPVQMDSVIIDKAYSPSEHSIGSGFSMNGSYVMTNNYKSEKFIIFFRENGEICKLSISGNDYFSLKAGDKIKYWKYWYGRKLITEEPY